MPTDPDPAERIRAALAGANLSDEQREALVADALAAIAELHAGESSGYYAPAPQPRERARRLREVATAARAAAQAERCFAAAAAELWPPDNLTGWGLWSALHGDAPATGLLRDAEDTTARAGALDRIAAAADAQAERWRAQPPVRGLSRGRPGLLGAVTGRAEAQTVRLALVYALSEGADRIGLRHLDGALAIWAYCAASAAYVFGDALGDRVADAALAAIREAGAEGVSRTDLRDLLGRGYGDRLTAALATLAAAGLAHGAKVVTGRAGRRAERWYPGRGNGAASDHAPFPKSPKSPESSESGAAEGYSGDFGDSGQGEPFGDEPPPPDDGDAPAWTAEEPEDWSEVVP